ncbi:MAG TPA: paraquat-inducible membrane protein A [Hyphomonas sp.]|uniref:paraquat-inducible protein A n=1 Tax=Sneathiella sp. TaxID=1964365 RepID=UPI000C3E325F|nr:paraquat-inducible protein A [Sneathiella sp.]MAL78333.1 paraquat-inducible membrane protein A [Sneathiella sp.]HCE23443.1 paraquat-inducible membrane protein A [Hyphomonas sp.]|tara:strand:- start:2725 stop:3357 length:633 start_codon:yes stop_codon:yes gene_type:complete
MRIDRHFTYTESHMACPECDLLHLVSDIREGEQGHCIRCGALLFVRHRNSLDRALAFSLTGLSFFILANLFPLLTFEMEGQTESNRLIDGAIAFWQAGYWELGIAVFIFSVFAPLAVLLVLVTLLLPLRLGRAPLFVKLQIRLLVFLKPWAMSEIFILGIIVAFVKLQDFADVGIGLSLFAFILMVIATVMAYLTLDTRALWARLEELAV